MKNTYLKIQSGLKTAAIAAGLGLLLALPSQAGDDTFKIARDRSVTGKYGTDTCDVFARDLYNRMTAAGGEAHYVVYDWQRSGRSGRHAIVVYRDAKGRYFGMDNSHRMPVLLAGHSPAAWAAWFDGPGDTRLVRTFTDESLSGEYADLSRAPRNIAQTDRMLAMK